MTYTYHKINDNFIKFCVNFELILHCYQSVFSTKFCVLVCTAIYDSFLQQSVAFDSEPVSKAMIIMIKPECEYSNRQLAN